jgi:hypothetical protein
LAFARGAPATLICRASGFPEVDFTWFIKRGRPDDKMEKGQLISKEIFINSSKMNAKNLSKIALIVPHGMCYLHFGNTEQARLPLNGVCTYRGAGSILVNFCVHFW